MTRLCTICAHSELEEINRRLVRGDSIAGIAREFAVSEDALRRHLDNHVPMTLAASPSAKEITDADKLLFEIETVKTRALSLLDKAEAAGDTKIYGPPSAYLKEFREYIRLMAELSGKIAAQPQINLQQVNIYQSPEWSTVGDALVEVLADYPELRREVAKRLLELAREGR